MSGCRDCGGRGNHLGGCPAAARTEFRSRVQTIVRASFPPAAGSTRNGQSRTPRLAQKVLGFRRWRLDGYRLLPLTPLMPASWRIGPNIARPASGRAWRNREWRGAGVGPHRRPHPRLSCRARRAHGVAYNREQPSQHIRAVRSVASEFYQPAVEHAELAAAAASLGRPIPPELRPAHAPSPAASGPTTCD